jgi:hypothetical protein
MLTHEEKLERRRVYDARYYAKVTGTLGATESPDIVVTTGDREALECEYLRRLMSRDAVIWRKHQNKHDSWMAPDDDTMKAKHRPPRRALPSPDGSNPGPLGFKWHMENGKRVYTAPAESDAREDAIAAGKKTYERAEPCDKCGTHLRYVNKYKCVKCKGIEQAQHLAAKRAAKKAAAERGRPHLPQISHSVPTVASGALGTGRTASRVSRGAH